MAKLNVSTRLRNKIKCAVEYIVLLEAWDKGELTSEEYTRKTEELLNELKELNRA